MSELTATSAKPSDVTGPGLASHDIWIFGYGSLMWRPDFAYEVRARAVVDGYHRAFCIRSTHHRGTDQRPGLVLGLDRGRSCTGIAYRVSHANAPAILAYLRQRELIYGVYRESVVTARLSIEVGTVPGAGTVHPTVQALAFTVEREHPSYVGVL